MNQFYREIVQFQSEISFDAHRTFEIGACSHANGLWCEENGCYRAFLMESKLTKIKFSIMMEEIYILSTLFNQ